MGIDPREKQKQVEKDAAKKRFDDLRNSGYKGWIDQDGYKAKGPDHWNPWPHKGDT